MMKLKKLVLQTMLAFAAATGLSAASSAQDVNYDYYYFEGTAWNSYHGTTDEHKGTPPQICEAIAKSYDRQDTATNYTSTVEGIYNDSYTMVMNPSGTVRWISCSIDVKTTNHYFSTGQTTVSQNYAGGTLVVTKEEAEFPSNPSMCNGRNKPGEIGGVACSESEMHVCFWPSAMDEIITDPKARQIVHTCTVEHETYHKNDDTGFCNERGRQADRTKEAWHRGEIAAYTIQNTCYEREREQCGANQKCIDEINSQILFTQDGINWHTNNMQ